MSEHEANENAAVCQQIVEGIITDPHYFLGEVLDLYDASDETAQFVSSYFRGLLDIIRGVE